MMRVPGTVPDPRPHFSTLIPFPIFTATVLLAAAPASGQTLPSPRPDEGALDSRIVGHVMDHDTGARIAGVVMTASGEGDDENSVVTDSEGRFVLEGLPPGTVLLAASHIAYADRTDAVHLEAERTVEVQVVLAREVVPLEGILVEVRSRALEMTGYYERQLRAGRGRQATRADFEGIAYRRTVDLIQEVPGIRLHPSPDGMGTDVRMSRVTGLRGDGRGCIPRLYVDGAPRPTTEINSIPLESVEAWEAYAGGTTPPEFSHACGVILIWSRR